MTKLNSLARARVIGPEGGAEDGAAGAGVGEGAAGVDVLMVSSSLLVSDCHIHPTRAGNVGECWRSLQTSAGGVS
jgi:hypothetical protein